MIHTKVKWLFVWAAKYNDLVSQLDSSMRSLSKKRQNNRELEDRIVKLKKSLRHEEQKRNEAVEREQEANKRADKQTEISDKNYHELKALKKKLSDNAIPTRDQKSGRYKKRA